LHRASMKEKRNEVGSKLLPRVSTKNKNDEKEKEESEDPGEQGGEKDNGDPKKDQLGSRPTFPHSQKKAYEGSNWGGESEPEGRQKRGRKKRKGPVKKYDSMGKEGPCHGGKGEKKHQKRRGKRPVDKTFQTLGLQGCKDKGGEHTGAGKRWSGGG